MVFFDPSWIVSATSETLSNLTAIIIYVCTHAIAFVQSFGEIGEPRSFSRRVGLRLSLSAVFKLSSSSARACFSRRPEYPDCSLGGLGRVLNHCFNNIPCEPCVQRFPCRRGSCGTARSSSPFCRVVQIKHQHSHIGRSNSANATGLCKA